MFAIVTKSGRYHGHVANAAEVATLKHVKDAMSVLGKDSLRLLNKQEWGQVVDAGDNLNLRAELCASLGKAIG